jgi:ADP-ribose pyrophosphatase YjhB (NUDIX family)
MLSGTNDDGSGDDRDLPAEASQPEAEAPSDPDRPHPIHRSPAALRPEFCIGCGAEAPERVCPECCSNPSCYVTSWLKSGRRVSSSHFYCRECGQCDERRDCRGPSLRFWPGPDGMLRHESCGVFVRTPDFRFLFYRRTAFPAGTTTVPSGHVDAREDGSGERPEVAAARELAEEIRIRDLSITAGQILPVATDDIVGDSCRLGSDAHQWHSFLAVLDSPIEPEHVTVIEEGTEPVLLTLEQALTKELTFPVRYVIERHADSLTR